MENPAVRKCRLAVAGNTRQYALAALYRKGYKVFIYPHPDDDERYHYWAIKDARDFIAETPEALLGLIGIWEQFGDDWLRQDVPRHWDALYDQTFPEDEYRSLDDEAFAGMVEDLRIFFAAIDEPMPAVITRKSLADFMLNFSKNIEERANRD